MLGRQLLSLKKSTIIPQVKNHCSYMLQAKKNQWNESLLQHVAENGESTQWLSYFLGKKYDGSFMLASEALGQLQV